MPQPSPWRQDIAALAFGLAGTGKASYALGLAIILKSESIPLPVRDWLVQRGDLDPDQPALDPRAADTKRLASTWPNFYEDASQIGT